MRILIIGGMHGNEPLGLEVVKLFSKKPVGGVDAVFANQQAIYINRRFVSDDLNRSFPGDISSRDYEPKRAAQLLGLTKNYDLVLDFHNTHCSNNSCGFLGETALKQLYDVSAWLGLNKVIVANYDCVNKYAPNCLSIEVSLDSEQNDAKYWYDQIVRLTTAVEIPAAVSLSIYAFIYRITLEDKKKFNLSTYRLEAFKPIPEELAVSLGVVHPAYPIFIADKYTPYNYGGLLNKIK